MKNLWLGVMLSSVAVAAAPSAWGQMHKVAKPQQVVRAVGVYEWTGDMAKPTASRVIPVSLYINGSLQDAGVYMSQPVPFALETGNVYELEKAGISDGQVDLEFARKLQEADGDGAGWFGYGSFKPLAPVKKAPALRASKTLPVIVGSKDDSRPHFGKADGTAAPADGTKDSSASAKPDAGSTTPDDSDRPTMIRRKPDADSSATTTATTASTASANENNPEDDPDRPTLKRRTPTEAKKARDEAESSGTGAVESLNNDPDRPNLHYGRPAGSLTETELPKLVGMPSNLHQMVAVSDAVDRDPHDFSRPWADAAERATVLAKMETMARAKLAQYGGTAVPAAAPTVAPKKTTVHGKVRHKAAVAAPPVVALLDEQLKGYTLSYGGAATYIFMAHTAGTGAALRYVTVVAQADDLGELKPALQTVTDATHMDRTPEMEFVDVVDADASNRASLLFELRAQNSRQFVLYRVIASEAQLIFAGGSIQ
ncbi:MULTISPECIES: hypothetical protein [Acidobacteriaceae]|uniref:hypothetical protein n=1 Tax=Acidobacteriaceae TaxID=204434 RepID=UPI00131E69D7|nr:MULTISPECIES: hypothetical protein [Acidobacteriaceae]MDW5267016.1 hypothetical protein [Edaphobacter sp.]